MNIQGKLKKVSEPLLNGGRSLWLAGLGTTAFGLETGSKLFQTLVNKGQGFEERHKPRVDGVQKKVSQKISEAQKVVTNRTDKMVKAGLNRLGVPSKEEIQRLTAHVEQLTEKLKTVEQV